MVGNANDVACKGGVEQLAALAHEADHRIGPQFFAAAHHLEPHAARELAAGNAQKCDAVAVGRVHVGLDFKDHTREFFLLRVDHALHGCAVTGGRSQVHQRVQHLLHAKVVDGRAKKHRCLFTRQKQLAVKFRRGPGDQFNLALGLGILGPKASGGLGVVQPGQNLVVTPGFVFTRAEHAHAVFTPVINAVKQFAHAHRPSKRHHSHAEFAFDLVHHAHRVLHLAVHLVDKRQNRRAARTADLQQSPGLGLDAVGSINHH